MVRLAAVLLLLAVGASSIGRAQSWGASQSADTAILARELLQDTTARGSAAGAEIPREQRKVSHPIAELRPIVEWRWGAVLATVLAMAGAIVLTLPVALAYVWTKPAHEFDPGVVQSSIVLAPTIAGLLIVIQGSLALAFSLAGVATAVRFRNSLKDTGDAVYLFLAIAMGLAAGVQALDIALAISLIFSATVVLLARSPLRSAGPTHQPEHPHHHHQPHDSGPSDGGSGAKFQRVSIRTGDTAHARPAVESVLDREAKRWRLESVAPDSTGAVTLVYAVRCRKRVSYDQLLAELSAAAGSQEFTVAAGSASGQVTGVPSPMPPTAGAPPSQSASARRAAS